VEIVENDVVVQQPCPKKIRKPYKIIALGVLVAVAVFFLVWFVFLKRTSSELISPFVSDSDLIDDEYSVSPLTGEKFPKARAEDWYNTRPLGVMVNNYIDARPQSGLIYADIVYEVVAEGGITRFMPFFLTNTPKKIGPVRSTREYYLTIVKELGDAMIMHEGYSPQAKEAIDSWPVRSLFRGGAAATANWRENSSGVAFEHTLYTDGAVLREVGNSLGWEGNRETTMWQFKDDRNAYVDMPEASDITIDFWYKGDYTAIFKYLPDENKYLRFMGYEDGDVPIPHLDGDTKEQIEVTNLVVQFVAESPIVGDDKNRLAYQLVGSGLGLVFVDGKVIEVTWTKESRDERTMFYDLDGNEIKFNRGKFWVSVVPDRNREQVVYY